MGKNIGVLVGSARRGSFSKAVANDLASRMPDGYEMHMLEIANLPLYNQDYDDDRTVPAEWTAFRAEVGRMDGFMFVTPEYNRSIPPILKNAIDIASRPYGQNMWGGKPGAVVSVSPGRLSGFGANHILRQSMVFLDVLMMQQPEAYVGEITKALDEQGKVGNKQTQAFLQEIANAFAVWVERLV